MSSFAAAMGTRVRDATTGVLDYFILGARAMRFAFSRPFYWQDTLTQMDRIGVGSIPIVLLTGLFTGMVLALQSSVELNKFGAAAYIGNLVGASMVRELGPVLCALMVAGRAAAGIAAELGSMRVTEQIDALQSFGTDPIKKLVTPRLIAGLVMLPVLTVITDMVGIFGGMIIAVFRIGATADIYLQGVLNTLAQSGFVFGFVPKDFIAGMVKPLVFGGIIALTACYYGLNTKGGTEGVGIAATRSVVTCSVLILAVDYFLTQLTLVVLRPGQ
ncbi:MAG TPA: ABC transporter permease [Longimicrobiales bacterium]|nr:ABC transporter permease [Longimicrobiales bacterium]